MEKGFLIVEALYKFNLLQFIQLEVDSLKIKAIRVIISLISNK